MKKDNVYVWTNPSKWESIIKVQMSQQKVEEIGIGQKHIIVRTQNRILGLGSNSTGQLGIDDCDDVEWEKNFKQFIKIPTKCIATTIRQVSCGWNHTVILDAAGTIYSTGDGKNGALGHGRGADSYAFKPISANLRSIVQVSAGRDHTLAISSTKVYGWGNSKEGQLGLVKQKIYYQPQQLYVYSSTICFAGPKYSVFNTEKGIYVTGCNEGGQLGLGHQNKIKLPKKITGIAQEAAEISGSTNYLMIKTVQNQYYLAGTGIFGQFLFPTKIKYFQKSEKVLIGQQYGIVRDQHNRIYSWNSSNDSQPVQNPQLSKLACQYIATGPKIVACVTNGSEVERYRMARNKQNHKLNQKSAAVNRNQIKMARSSIEWGNKQLGHNNMFGESIPNSIDNESIFKENQRKGRKQSQAIQARLNSNIYDQHLASNSTSQEENIDKHYFNYQDSGRERENNFRYDKDSGMEQIKSPHFKKQLSNSYSQEAQEIYDNEETNRISGFQAYQLQDRIHGHLENKGISRNSMNRSRERSIQTISEQTSPLGLTNNMTSKTLSKEVSNCNLSNKMKPMDIPQSQLNYQNEFQYRLRYLQNQNRKKDKYIKKMRKQFIELIDIVQSDICLKNIAQMKQKDYLSKKRQELHSSQVNQTDVFTKNMMALRGILGKTIDSLTYDSLYYSD